MTFQRKNPLTVLVLGIVILLASCKGKDGENGAGFDEAVKYGNISTTFSGKRPKDSVAFSAVQNFKYYPAGENPGQFADVYINKDDGSQYFTVYRYVSGVDESYNNDFFYFDLSVSSKGEVTDFNFHARTNIIDKPKYFGINEYYYDGDHGSDESVEIKDFSFDPKTGKLKFTFTWTIKKSYSTGYDLTTKGAVDVIVLEALNNINNNAG